MLLERKVLLSKTFFHTNLKFLILLKINTVKKSHSLMMGTLNLAILIFSPRFLRFRRMRFLFATLPRFATAYHKLKAGFHQRRSRSSSRSRSRNQKRRAIRSSENQTDGVGSRTPFLISDYDSVAYDLVKTSLSESEAKAEE